MLRSSLLTVRRNLVNLNMTRGIGKPPRCDAHMNELPVPCLPWDQWYKEKQSFYNKVMVFGIGWFGFSVFMVAYTGSIFFNWGPPEKPGPPSDMVPECED